MLANDHLGCGDSLSFHKQAVRRYGGRLRSFSFSIVHYFGGWQSILNAPDTGEYHLCNHPASPCTTREMQTRTAPHAPSPLSRCQPKTSYAPEGLTTLSFSSRTAQDDRRPPASPASQCLGVRKSLRTLPKPSATPLFPHRLRQRPPGQPYSATSWPARRV
jgi:hypothetical protein